MCFWTVWWNSLRGLIHLVQHRLHQVYVFYFATKNNYIYIDTTCMDGTFRSSEKNHFAISWWTTCESNLFIVIRWLSHTLVFSLQQSTLPEQVLGIPRLWCRSNRTQFFTWSVFFKTQRPPFQELKLGSCDRDCNTSVAISHTLSLSQILDSIVYRVLLVVWNNTAHAIQVSYNA